MQKDLSTLRVEGMSCNHCVNAIQKAVGALNGVDDVRVDLKDKKVSVEYDSGKVSLATIIDTIEDQGYDVEK